MEDFVPFELAVKLKEKGFKEKCIAYYWEKINEDTPSFVVEDNMPEDGICILDLISEHNKAEWSPFIDAPIISQVLKHLRNKYLIHIFTKPYPCEDGIMWMYEIREFSKYISVVVANKTGFIKEEQAAIAGIEYVLDKLI
jgi:hypothetical protein